jgi:integrase
MQQAAIAPLAGAQTSPSVAQGEPSTLTFGELIDAYMSVYAGRDRTRASRLARWKALLGDRPAVVITDDDVLAALDKLGSEPARKYAGRDVDGVKILRASAQLRSPATVNRYHAALGAVYTWAIRRRKIPRDTVHPCRQLEQHTEPAGRIRFLSDDERARLLEACRRAPWPKLYALVLLAITTGARRGELEALTWGDVDLVRAVARVRVSKNGQPRTLPLVPATVAALQALKPGEPERLVFSSARRPRKAFRMFKAWHAALDAAAISDFRFHDLRHSCASYLAQSGASILEIGDVLGHKTLRMTQRYAHLTVQTKAALVNRVLGSIQ